MTDKPILFSAPMVRALLAGTKTQTRRGLSIPRYRSFTEFGPSDTEGYDWHLRDSGMRWHDLRHAELLKLLPYKVGDRLYVREQWKTTALHDATAPRDLPTTAPIYFTADDRLWPVARYRQGMHMPRWASRITLHVTEVRVQRLQEIGHADCQAEGVRHVPNQSLYDLDLGDGEVMTSTNPFSVYHQLWNRINGAGSWEANPWVTATSFQVEKINIDQARAT